MAYEIKINGDLIEDKRIPIFAKFLTSTLVDQVQRTNRQIVNETRKKVFSGNLANTTARPQGKKSVKYADAFRGSVHTNDSRSATEIISRHYVRGIKK